MASSAASSDCEPVRDKLPKDAVAGIECLGKDWFVARVGYYLFENDEEMLEHYFARMQAEGVTLDEGSCFDGEGEGAYIPGDEEVASRQGCFITAQGVANYRLTLPGAHVYIGIVGHNIDTIELEDFAFLGNRDTPAPRPCGATRTAERSGSTPRPPAIAGGRVSCQEMSGIRREPAAASAPGPASGQGGAAQRCREARSTA